MTGEMLSSVDPIGGGLRVLLDDFNAIDIGPNGPWQPLVETERVPLRPIFARAEGAGVTFLRQWAKKRRSREGTKRWCPIVVGFAGSYNGLHATLHEHTRSRGVGYAEQVATVDILRRRMRHTSDWHTFGKISRDPTGAWLHAWVLQDVGGLANSAERLRKELNEPDAQGESFDPQWLTSGDPT